MSPVSPNPDRAIAKALKLTDLQTFGKLTHNLADGQTGQPEKSPVSKEGSAALVWLDR